jgi:hypothetical protein
MRKNNLFLNKSLISISSRTNEESSFSIVYEWENIISQELHLKICKHSKITDWIYRQIEHRLNARDFLHYFLPSSSGLSLLFVMTASTSKNCRLTKNTIPVIIDFWLRDSELYLFYENYKHCPLILITSLEVFYYLKEHNCPLNIEHWPLSLPDNLRLSPDDLFDKEWDLAILGRANPYFSRMLKRYSDEHPDFEYILGSDNIDRRFFFTNKGNCVGNAVGRQAYLEMLRRTKISLYTTPGLDEAKFETDYFNQVTPRFLEMIASGCLVLAHYPKNADTDYYEMEKLCKDINSYEEFETLLDAYRDLDKVPIVKYSEYLSVHYTSQRIGLLLDILMKNNIKVNF